MAVSHTCPESHICPEHIQADLLCYFLLNERLGVSSQFNSFFVLYISTAKPFSLLLIGYIEVKINKHEILQAFDPGERCLKYMKGIFSPYAVWHSCFLIPPQSFYGKRAKSLEKFFFPALKMQFGLFY